MPTDSPVPLRKMPERDFYFQDNEFADLYSPLIGPFAAAVYSALCRKWYRKEVVEYSIRDLGRATGMSPAAAARALQSLQTIGLVRLFSTSGNRKSEYQLVDVKALAATHGAKRERKGGPLALPPPISDKLRSELAALRGNQQGKRNGPARFNGGPRKESAFGSEMQALSAVSQRDASVSQLIRQRSTRETQTGAHLIQKKGRNEEVPTPTPSHDGDEPLKDKDSPDEYEAGELLKWAVDRFTGVIDDLRACLLDTNRPPNSHLENGAVDWERFGFGSLAVDVAAWDGETLVLTLSASNSAAQLGLEKYRERWGAALLHWYGCNVRCELQRTNRTRWITR